MFCKVSASLLECEEILVEGDNDVASLYRLFSIFQVFCSSSQIIDGNYHLKSFSAVRLSLSLKNVFV